MLLFLLRRRERDEGESERESGILLLLLLPLMSLQSPMKNARDVEAPTVSAADLLKGLVLLALAVSTFT
jgi:hypothetical protein